jgi:hypothetical protein
VIAEEVKRRAMEIVATRPSNYIDRPGECGAGREVEIHTGDPKLLNSFLRKTHSGAAVPHSHDAAAIDRDPSAATVVASSRRTQDRHKHPVAAGARRRLTARLELRQLKKAAAVQRQVLDLTAADPAADGVGIVLHLGCGGVHRDRVGYLTNA